MSLKIQATLKLKNGRRLRGFVTASGGKSLRELRMPNSKRRTRTEPTRAWGDFGSNGQGNKKNEKMGEVENVNEKKDESEKKARSEVEKKKIISEDEGDSVNEDARASTTLPKGTIRLHATRKSNSNSNQNDSSSSSSSSVSDGEKMPNEAFAFDPLAGSVDISMDDFSFAPNRNEKQRQR